MTQSESVTADATAIEVNVNVRVTSVPTTWCLTYGSRLQYLLNCTLCGTSAKVFDEILGSLCCQTYPGIPTLIANWFTKLILFLEFSLFGLMIFCACISASCHQPWMLGFAKLGFGLSFFYGFLCLISLVFIFFPICLLFALRVTHVFVPEFDNYENKYTNEFFAVDVSIAALHAKLLIIKLGGPEVSVEVESLQLVGEPLIKLKCLR